MAARLLRGIGLAAAFASLGWAARTAAGDLPAQLAAVHGAGDPTADPADAVLAVLALAAEALSAYLLVVALLASAGTLPGAIGRLGTAALRMIAIPVLRRGLETALGGVLLAHVALGPAGAQPATAASLATAPWPHRAVPVASAAMPTGRVPPMPPFSQRSPVEPQQPQPPQARLPRAQLPQAQPQPRPSPPVGAASPVGSASVDSSAPDLASAGSVPLPLSTVLTAGVHNAVLGAVLGADEANQPSPANQPSSAPDAQPPPAIPGSTSTGTPRGNRPAPQISPVPDAGTASRTPPPTSGGPTAPHGPAGPDAPVVPETRDDEPRGNGDDAKDRPAPRYAVAPGDTLWGIARSRLPAGRKSPSEIAAYWPLIYTANRQVIGDDPDLIRPGMRLAIPPPGDPGADR